MHIQWAFVCCRLRVALSPYKVACRRAGEVTCPVKRVFIVNFMQIKRSSHLDCICGELIHSSRNRKQSSTMGQVATMGPCATNLKVARAHRTLVYCWEQHSVRPRRGWWHCQLADQLQLAGCLLFVSLHLGSRTIVSTRLESLHIGHNVNLLASSALIGAASMRGFSWISPSNGRATRVTSLTHSTGAGSYVRSNWH